MFFLLDQPSQNEFEALSSRYDKMEISSTRALVKLLRTGSDLLAGFEKLLGTYGLSQGRFLILVVMNRNPEKEITPSLLAEKIGVTRATMTGLIKSLEKDRLIGRNMIESDRRRQCLKLTPGGIRVLEAILPDYYGRISRLMAGLESNQKDGLVRILEQISRGIPFLTESDPDISNRVIICEYSPRDTEEIFSLILNIQQNEFQIPITAAAQPDLSDIPNFYQSGRGNFWVARIEGILVGTLALKDIGERQVALRKMFVDKRFRGNTTGVAASLLRRALDWARAQGIRDIYLGTTDRFLAAHRFYEKNGFISIPVSDLPKSFPVMAVDTRFYHLNFHP